MHEFEFDRALRNELEDDDVLELDEETEEVEEEAEDEDEDEEVS